MSENNFQDFQDFAKRETLEFAREHKDEDTARLMLSASRYPAIDMAAAVQQIEGLRTAREKWPSLLDCKEFVYPPRLNREQASSEATAQYKANLLLDTLAKSIKPNIDLWITPKAGERVVDLTGGMGIDTMAFARVAEHVDYVERDPQLCTLTEHNLKALGIENVTVHCTDSMEYIRQLPDNLHTIIYIDPARRTTSGRKVTAFEDCEPNILQHKELLLSHCHRFIVKASPMIDIDFASKQLATVKEVHIVGVKGECKEVLFVCGGEPEGEPQIVCCNQHILNNRSIPNNLTFTRSEEAAAEGCYCQQVGRYLYEPDATLMKGGAFKLIAQRYGVKQLGRNTHLYTAERRINDFPGRVFEVLQELKLSRREMATTFPEGRAHVVTRNYPVEAAVLQKQLGLKEGGDRFVIATSIGSRKSGFLCKM